MASLSFRDRFFSPPVGRALTSPSGILAFGAGVALGVIATFSSGGLAVPLIAGAVGGLLGYGTRVAVAIPRKGRSVVIDPFGVGEPWRHAVMDAQQARRRYDEALKTFRTGPLHDSLVDIGERIDEAIEQCWIIAQQGHQLAQARKQIDDRDLRWQLERAASQIPPGGVANETQERTVASLNAQLATGQRMDAMLSSTFDQLALINARLDETVTQAIELSVTNQSVGLTPVGDSVEQIIDSLTSLRTAMSSMDESPQVLRLDAPTPTAELPPPPTTEPGPGTDGPGEPRATPGS